MKRLLSIGIPILIILFFIAYRLVKHYLILDDNDYIPLFGWFFLLFGLFFSYAQLRINYNFNKRKATIDFIFKNIQTELFPSLRKVKEYTGRSLLIFNPEEKDVLLNYYNAIAQDAQKQKEFHELLLDIFNFYERMSIGILKQSFDEDICYDDHGYNLIQFFSNAKSYIVYLRNRVNEPRIFINFEHIAMRWEKRHAKSVGQQLITNRNI